MWNMDFAFFPTSIFIPACMFIVLIKFPTSTFIPTSTTIPDFRVSYWHCYGIPPLNQSSIKSDPVSVFYLEQRNPMKLWRWSNTSILFFLNCYTRYRLSINWYILTPLLFLRIRQGPLSHLFFPLLLDVIKELIQIDVIKKQERLERKILIIWNSITLKYENHSWDLNPSSHLTITYKGNNI